MEALEKLFHVVQQAPLFVRILAIVVVVLSSVAVWMFLYGALFGSSDSAAKVQPCGVVGPTKYGYVIESIVMTSRLPERPNDGRGPYVEEVEIAYMVCALRDLGAKDLFDEEYHSDEMASIVRVQGSGYETEADQGVSDASRGKAWFIPLEGLKAGEHKAIVTRARIEYPSWENRLATSAGQSRKSHMFKRMTVNEDGVCYPNESDYVRNLEIVVLSTTPIEEVVPDSKPINQLSAPPGPGGGRVERDVVVGSTRLMHSARASWTDVFPNTRVGLKVTRTLQ